MSAATTTHGECLGTEDLDEKLGVIRALGHTVRALNEIALLQDSCPLGAEVAVRGLREVKAEVAPDVELETMSLHDALGQGRN
jgi:hypothetical protein